MSVVSRRKKKSNAVIEDAAPYHAKAPFRFIDLFCGIGGFRYAFERVGSKCVFSSDWDKYSQITYEANFGEKPHGDIHSVAVADIPAHDILCGGFPCQPFSLAGVSKKTALEENMDLMTRSRETSFSPSRKSWITINRPPSYSRTSRI